MEVKLYNKENIVYLKKNTGVEEKECIIKELSSEKEALNYVFEAQDKIYQLLCVSLEDKLGNIKTLLDNEPNSPQKAMLKRMLEKIGD